MARRGSRSTGNKRPNNINYLAFRSEVKRYTFDNRMFHPAGRLKDRPVPVYGPAINRRLVVRKSNTLRRKRNDPFVSWLVGFAVPDFIAVCARRKERKEILHAKRKVGKGSGGGARRYTSLSNIVC